MSKDQSYGFVIFAISLIVGIAYLAAVFAPWIGLDPRLQFYAIAIPVVLLVLMVLAISAWIGWTMLTTPPPAPLEAGPTTPTASQEPAEKTEENRTS